MQEDDESTMSKQNSQWEGLQCVEKEMILWTCLVRTCLVRRRDKTESTSPRIVGDAIRMDYEEKLYRLCACYKEKKNQIET